ncbi:hypothetical protein J437_LFUL006601 [Ladona fulva]|uniref:Uncharacterized protein n=1 Tax=Ladona fulva TaxID=123851 RepID=A0A8K0P8N5_LADFU|nr:hypothetical protein J437_LFUL006601 [Ladona fulva]
MPEHKSQQVAAAREFLGYYRIEGDAFFNDGEVKEAVTNWTKEVAGSFYEEGISKLISWYTKSIEVARDYVEK